MRLLHPLPNLRRHSTTAFEEIEETRFAVCRASPFNDHDASSSTTGHDLFGSPALLSERDDRPSLCASPSVRPVESGRPRQNWFARLRPRPTTSEHQPDRPAGSNPRLTGRASTANVAHVKTALAMGTVALLALMAMACGSSDAPSSPADDQPAVVSSTQERQTATEAPTAKPASSQPAEEPRDNSATSNQDTPPEPTEAPEATATPENTATPAPTPTPTIVLTPTPTPFPKGTMLEHLKGYAFKEPLLENLRLYNIELISIAIAPYVTDYVFEEYSPNDQRRYIEYHVPSRIPAENAEFLEVLDGEDAEHLHVRVKLRYFPPGAGSGVTYHEILIDAAFEIVDAPYGEAGEHVYQSLHADLPQLPVFSHLLSDPVIGPGQK